MRFKREFKLVEPHLKLPTLPLTDFILLCPDAGSKYVLSQNGVDGSF